MPPHEQCHLVGTQERRSGAVKIEVTSAFLVEGEIARPGSQVSLPRAEALALVARGKAAVGLVGSTGEAGPQPELDESHASDVSRSRRRRRLADGSSKRALLRTVGN